MNSRKTVGNHITTRPKIVLLNLTILNDMRLYYIYYTRQTELYYNPCKSVYAKLCLYRSIATTRTARNVTNVGNFADKRCIVGINY